MEGKDRSPLWAPVLWTVSGLLLLAVPAAGQQLEPRAYEPAPVGLNTLGVAYTDSSGSVGFDPSVPLESV
jgi:hypothetical protein